MTDRFNDPRPIIYTSITFPWLPVFLGRMHYTASSYPARPCLHEEVITFAKGRWDSCHRQDVSHRFASWSGLCCVLWFAQWSSTTAVFSICIYLFLVSSYCVESVLYIWLRPNLLIGVFLRRFLPGEEAQTRTHAHTHTHTYIYMIWIVLFFMFFPHPLLHPISSRYDHLDYLLLETRRISATRGRGAAALAIACPSHPAMPAMAMASLAGEGGRWCCGRPGRSEQLWAKVLISRGMTCLSQSDTYSRTMLIEPFVKLVESHSNRQQAFIIQVCTCKLITFDPITHESLVANRC